MTPSKPKPAEQATGTTAPQGEPPVDAGVPAKRSAMKLPPGVVPRAGQGPLSRNPWQTGGGTGGRPQTDFARRMGKSRKVH
ncbi:MAG: hypothetical protein ACT4QA_04100 [Panacagrimonas sp.]